MKCLPLLSLSALLVACQINHNGLNPTALQEYIALTDAKATVKAIDAKKSHVDITPKIAAKPKDTTNSLYQSDGTIIFQGLPASFEQLLLINADGSVTEVENFSSNPEGTYIGFTPTAIYHINRATGESIKYPRVNTITIPEGSTPLLPGQQWP